MNFDRFSLERRFWDWVHPSQRDLVIDQLSASSEMSKHYLKHGGIPAITLALSQSGGALGSRTFPLLIHDGSWDVLAEASITSILDDHVHNTTRIFTVLEDATLNPADIRVRDLVFRVCSAVREYWDREHIILSSSLIARFLKLCEKTERYLSSPSLQLSWEHACKQLREEADEAINFPSELTVRAVDHWVSFVEVISATEPRLIPKGSLQSLFIAPVTLYLEAFENLVEEEFEDEDPDRYKDEAERLTDVAGTARSLIPFFKSKESDLDSVADKLIEKAESLEEQAEQMKRDLGLIEPDDDEREGPSHRESQFDVNVLFEDL